MSATDELRFQVGTSVLCNFGPDGWKLGRIVAVHYREAHWPQGKVAPYQVLLETAEEDNTNSSDALGPLIYVPEDNDYFCRKAQEEDVRIHRRRDALDVLETSIPTGEGANSELWAERYEIGRIVDTSGCHRGGRCSCCNPCPTQWSAVELYSEHYRCAERNGIRVSRVSVDLGTVRAGDTIQYSSRDQDCRAGFHQCPTLVRLPPGVQFHDDGSLEGMVAFDPYREAEYKVNFVACSTRHWNEMGIVRLEIVFTVKGNVASAASFDRKAFHVRQTRARNQARAILQRLDDIWSRWEKGEIRNSETCSTMREQLKSLRTLL